MKTYKIEKGQNPRQIMLNVWNVVCEAVQDNSVVIEIKQWSKSREQERKYHAMIADISRQVTFDGNKRYSSEVWKARLVEQFAFEMEQCNTPLRRASQTVISLDCQRVITIRPSTREFSIGEASQFIEYLYSQGAEMGVRWTDPEIANYQQYPEVVGGN